MRYKLKSMNTGVIVEVTQYGIALINMISSISHQHGELKQVVMAIVQSDKRMSMT